MVPIMGPKLFLAKFWKEPSSAPLAGAPDVVQRSGAGARRAVTCDLTPLGSNYTFLVTLQDAEGEQVKAIYKPVKGEVPLWDFPHGTLHLRECASYLLAEALGWHFIPRTILRDGPYGEGSMQRYVEHNPRDHYFTLREGYTEQFPRICLFDLLTNNADRKAGHTILGVDERIWGIDHGLTFNAHPKLRTVIWDFAGEPIPDELQQDLCSLQDLFDRADDAVLPIVDILHARELEALRHRLASSWTTPSSRTPTTPVSPGRGCSARHRAVDVASTTVRPEPVEGSGGEGSAKITQPLS